MSVATQLGSEADTEPDIAERPDEEMRGDDSDDGDIARRSEDAYTDTVADAGNGTGGGPSSGEPHGKPGHALGEPGEPDTPGTGPDQQPPGGKRGKKPDLPRSVLRSFVGAPRADDAQRDSGMLGQDTEDEGPDVNRAGVDAVLVYERERGRVPKEQRHTNPGYDVLSKSATGEDDRYIEIKSRSDSWVDAQTALSPTQHRMALEYGDRYWLYVVERATSATYEIHAIQNPIGRATHFGFDPGWMAVEEDELIAEPDDGDPSEPVASSTEP
jgi:hypothetical protein